MESEKSSLCHLLISPELKQVSLTDPHVFCSVLLRANEWLSRLQEDGICNPAACLRPRHEVIIRALQQYELSWATWENASNWSALNKSFHRPGNMKLFYNFPLISSTLDLLLSSGTNVCTQQGAKSVNYVFIGH